jgi:hypothetical protein
MSNGIHCTHVRFNNRNNFLCFRVRTYLAQGQFGRSEADSDPRAHVSMKIPDMLDDFVIQ